MLKNRFGKEFTLIVIFLVCGLIINCAGSSSATGIGTVNKSHDTEDRNSMTTPFNDEEGKDVIVSGQIEHIFIKDGEEKIGVAIAPFAQMFFLYRSDANFEQNLGILNAALKSKVKVQCTVRQYSGRILSIAEAE